MQSTTILPVDYRQQITLDLSNSKPAIIGAIASGIVLLITITWMLVKFSRFLRPTALEVIRLHNILTITPDGKLFIVLPIVDAIVALVLVVLIHELVHGLIFWWYSGNAPRLASRGYTFMRQRPRRSIFLATNILLSVCPPCATDTCRTVADADHTSYRCTDSQPFHRFQCSRCGG